ncbi:MAG: putative selenium-dependent hydroxylase accessory protein YqeC [Acidimicrobiales bacterium]|nr:putative selenium-dependent hydroxylase accessory protein YqeC [Acidimicrobiales bacterium]
MAGLQHLTPLSPPEAALALDVHVGEVVALVGGGGKTSLMFALGCHHGAGTVLTTTTRMDSRWTGDATVLLRPTPDQLAEALGKADPVLVWDRIDGDKAVGVGPSVPATWSPHADRVIVEADGSRGMPAKAPGPHEPVLPDDATTVVAVMGADSLDRVIEDRCHRPLRVAAVVGCSPYERLNPERAASLLLHPDGSRRGVGESQRFTVAITKVGLTNRTLVDHLVSELRDRSPTTGIVLIADMDQG